MKKISYSFFIIIISFLKNGFDIFGKIKIQTREKKKKKGKKIYIIVFDSTDTRRQRYAQKVSNEQFSKHHSGSTILHVDADRFIWWLESNSI